MTRSRTAAMWIAGAIAMATPCLPAVCHAEVTKIEILSRTEVLGGRSFGATGPYQYISARVYFAVDPDRPANRIITDIGLAPRNAAARVEFTADLFVLEPRDRAKGNGTVFFEVSNRGGKRLAEMFNFAAEERDARIVQEVGDGFLLERGYTLVWVGWQFDVPDRPGLMRLYPAVVKGVTGLVRSEFVPNRKVTTFSLADREHRPYPVLDPNDPAIQLTVRERGEGSRTVIPRDQWKFNGTNVEMTAGFEPGRFYDVVYRAQDAPLVGLGPAAVRDVIAFFKFGCSADTTLGDEHQFIKRAIGFGMSQGGRFLRAFLYYGFNQDEQGRQVFDGVWPHDGGGGRGSFNHRFAQASRDGYLMLNTFYPTDLFPFTDLPQQDPETGVTEGLLDRAVAAKVVPKMFFTNGSFEYWGRNASLIHTTVDATGDMKIPPTSRIYFITGAQHFAGVFPPERENTRYLANPNDYTFVLRALLVALTDWVAAGKEPPLSAYPLIAKGELVPPDGARFPKIPNVTFPTRWLRAWRLDFGPEFKTKGLVTIDPPKVGRPFATMVSQVDEDGNEIAGIRLPELQVPLGTYTGWNFRDPKIGAPDSLINMVGSFLPFPRTRAERESSNDPRRSIEERYPSRDMYLGKIQAAAGNLTRARYVLASDLPRIVERAATEWDQLTANER